MTIRGLARYLKIGGILLAKSPEQNLCEKICSHHGAKLDENRTFDLTNSTIMHSVGSVCRLVVTSPTVSLGFRQSNEVCPVRPRSLVCETQLSSGVSGQ